MRRGSFPITAAGQPRILTGFPCLSECPGDQPRGTTYCGWPQRVNYILRSSDEQGSAHRITGSSSLDSSLGKHRPPP